MNTENIPRGIMRIRRLSLRFAALFLLIFPSLTPLLNMVSVLPYLPAGVPVGVAKTLPYIGYGGVAFSIIVWTVGPAGLVRLLAAAIPIAMAVAFARAVVPNIPLIGQFLQGSKTDEDVAAAALLQFVTMLIVIPLPLFAVQCFPLAEFILRFRQKFGSISETGIRVAIALRIYSAVIDAIASFWRAWVEENPGRILPRHRSEASSMQKFLKFPLWFIGAGRTWSFALLIYAIEQIPPLIYQLDATISKLENGRGGE
jgi:hypothetical protein